jgi:hypothetical protein
MVIEDLHWIDSASEVLLTKIVDSEAKLQLLLLHSRRPEHMPPWLDRRAVTRMLIDPLAVGDIRHLLQARLGIEALPDALTRQVTDRAEGNPLFAEEIVSFLLVTASWRIQALTTRALNYPYFDPAGHHVGRLHMILGLLYKAKKKRVLASDHLLAAKRILFQFGQTPLLTRVETALAELGQ